MSTTRKPKSFLRAKAEGMLFFWAHMHVGHTTQFVGQSWEGGGFSVGDSGDPQEDCRGNTVAKFSVESLDPANSSHLAQCEEWFHG